jgi:predicted Zn-dependent protease
MGHEVAHALADHGAQRMSAQSLQELGMVAGNVALQKDSDRELFNSAYGVGASVGVMLPFSRSHESEADKIGLKIMAIAGYDPAEAPELWKRMKAMNKGGTPEFLSTHPSDDRRISDLTTWVPEARAEAKKFGVTSFQ